MRLNKPFEITGNVLYEVDDYKVPSDSMYVADKEVDVSDLPVFGKDADKEYSIIECIQKRPGVLSLFKVVALLILCVPTLAADGAYVEDQKLLLIALLNDLHKFSEEHCRKALRYLYPLSEFSENTDLLSIFLKLVRPMNDMLFAAILYGNFPEKYRVMALVLLEDIHNLRELYSKNAELVAKSFKLLNDVDWRRKLSSRQSNWRSQIQSLDDIEADDLTRYEEIDEFQRNKSPEIDDDKLDCLLEFCRDTGKVIRAVAKDGHNGDHNGDNFLSHISETSTSSVKPEVCGSPMADSNGSACNEVTGSSDYVNGKDLTFAAEHSAKALTANGTNPFFGDFDSPPADGATFLSNSVVSHRYTEVVHDYVQRLEEYQANRSANPYSRDFSSGSSVSPYAEDEKLEDKDYTESSENSIFGNVIFHHEQCSLTSSADTNNTGGISSSSVHGDTPPKLDLN